MEFDATFLIAAISFIVFVFIMNAIFYSPILRIIEAREKVVEDNFNNANDLKKEAQKQLEYHDNELEQSRNKARLTLDNEIQRLKGEKAHAIADYKSQLYSNIQQEKENLKNSAIEAKATLEHDVIDIAKNISNILLGNCINSETIDNAQIKEEQL